VTDYDGTIAPIVSDPTHAPPVPGVVEHLDALVSLVRGVVVLSGRSETSLRSLLPVRGVLLIGENGIEALTPEEDVRLRLFRERATVAVERWSGAVIEAKTASISVHFRSQPEIGAELERVLADLIHGSGLMMVANRMVFDIQPRRGTKLRCVCRLIREMKPVAILYAGDSREDAHVHRGLKAARIETLCIGLKSTEMPADLFKYADLILDGPSEMSALLGRLVQRWRDRTPGLLQVPDAVST